MSSFLNQYWQKKVCNSVRDYYFTLPNSSSEAWDKIASNPLSFNLLWRSALNTVVQPKIPLNCEPPPSHYRVITEFLSGRDASRRLG